MELPPETHLQLFLLWQVIILARLLVKENVPLAIGRIAFTATFRRHGSKSQTRDPKTIERTEVSNVVTPTRQLQDSPISEGFEQQQQQQQQQQNAGNQKHSSPLET